MKKFISAFLSVVMLLSFAMGMNLTVFADDSKTITSASLTPIKPYTIYEGAYGFYNDGVGYYLAPYFNAGDIINITFSDETKATYTYYEQYDRQGWFASNNDEITVGRYSFYADKLGETYVSYNIIDFDFNIENVSVTIVNNPVDSFSFVPAKPYKFIENTNGYYDEDDGCWYYHLYYFNIDDKIIVNYTNGTSEEYNYKQYASETPGVYYRDFINSKNEKIELTLESVSLEGTGKTTSKAHLYPYGKTTDVPIEIIKNPVDSFSFTSVNPYEVEHLKGYAEDEDWWLEAPDFNKGDYVTVYFKDGTQDVYTCKEDGGCEFYNSNNEMVTVYSYEFSFNGTGTTSFTVKLYEYGKTQQVPVTVVDNSSSGSTSGGSTSGGGSTGGGGAAPAPAPTTDDSQKTEEQKPTTSTTTTTTTETQKPATVKVSKTKAKKNGVVVTWKTAKDVTGYQIQLATDKKFKKNKKTVTVAKKNASKKTVKKLKSKKKYYVRVRSYKIVNGKKAYGKWSKVKAVKTK